MEYVSYISGRIYSFLMFSLKDIDVSRYII